MIGEALGNYRLVAKLGSGSMGVVFLAEHQRIARRVAIKLLAPELVRDQQLLQRFFNEARATSLIRHPGIVDVFDCDVDAHGRAYMVMEHLEGETLADRLRQAGRLPWTVASLIAGQVADALGAAHGKGIVHRDLKPENVFLVADRRDSTAVAVKVLDFGVAKLLAVDAMARLTMRGMLVGTPEYMSPEQCGGAGDVDDRSDVYALGCILFEMLSGLPPFVADDVQELIAAHRFRPAPSLPGHAAQVPAWLADLLARMLSKAPGERPASMHAVSAALRDHLAPEPAAPPAAALGRRRRPWRAEIAIGLAGLLALTGAVWAAHRRPAFDRTSRKSAQALVPAPAPALPAAAPATQIGPAANPMPPEPAPERGARPARRSRPPTAQPRHVVETDGIVDL